MKTSLLKTALSIAVTTALFTGATISSQAFAEEMIIDDYPADNLTSNEQASESYILPSMAVGAATGTLIAGPIGFVVGGLTGALFGSIKQDSNDQENSLADVDNNNPENTLVYSMEADSYIDNYTDTSSDYEYQADVVATASVQDEQQQNTQPLQLAQLGSIDTIADNEINSQEENIMNILVSDLSLDVYFRSGSTDIEKFYPARLGAIADLLNSMDKLELHLDGYTDRRGDKDQNVALANKRIDKVRDQLISAGVNENRIKSKAFGEAKMKSTAGNLEAYTFDRRVVIRFERLTNHTDNMASISTPSVENDSTEIATRF